MEKPILEAQSELLLLQHTINVYSEWIADNNNELEVRNQLGAIIERYKRLKRLAMFQLITLEQQAIQKESPDPRNTKEQSPSVKENS
jgi:hypothetical protein